MVFKFLIRGLILISFVSCSTQQLVQQQDISTPTDIAPADSSSIEWVEIYFNMPADKTVAIEGNDVNDKTDLLDTFIRLVDSAEYSIDLSIYNLENHEVGEALVRAADRGVRIRIVTDYYNRFRDRELGEDMWNMLGNAGIYSIDDAGEVFYPDGSVKRSNRLPGASYDMHNKFAIIDYMSEDPNDYYVWTGSMNLTYTGPYNSNNTIVIKDSGIAEAYHKEFVQMWGGNNDVPNSAQARFHKDKEYIGEHIFYVDTTKVELYFAPINRQGTKPSVADRLNDLVHDYAQHDVSFLAFAITPDIPMSQTIWNRSSGDGLQLQGVIDPRFYGRYRNIGAIWASPEAQMGNRNIVAARELRTLHHKYLLVDAANPDQHERGKVFSGSYNFSRNAEENNDENALIFHSYLIANQYYQDFKGTMNRAEGKTEPPIPRIAHEQWYPVMRIHDANQVDIEIEKRFGYPVRFLGVQAPRIYAGQDSSEYYSLEAAQFLENLLRRKQVRMYGFDLFTPEVRNRAFHAYIQAKDSTGNIMDINQELLRNGFGEWSVYYRQHPDSVKAFQNYTKRAREDSVGMWETPERAGELVTRVELDAAGEVPVVYPININLADERTLQALTGIGPSFATRIVEYRMENGEFRDIDELTNIHGIGAVTMEKIRPYITAE